MRSTIAAVILGLAGCETLFPLVGPEDGGPRCKAVNDVVELPLVADTYVDGQDLAHGDETSVQLGAGRTPILRFRLGSLRVADLAYRLTINHAPHADECGGPCGACQAGAGAAAVALTRPDWDEQVVTSTIRAPGSPWTTPGPADPDVSDVFPFTSTSDGNRVEASFTGEPLAFDPSWDRGEISVLLLDSLSPAPNFFVSRTNTCDAIAPPALVGLCRDSALCGNDTVDAFVGETCDDGNHDDGDGCSASCRIE